MRVIKNLCINFRNIWRSLFSTEIEVDEYLMETRDNDV